MMPWAEKAVPPEARRQFETAVREYREGHFGEATRRLRILYQHDPDWIPAGELLALSLVALGNHEEAEPLLETLLVRHPGSGTSRFGLGVIACERKQWTRALEHFEAILKDSPEHPEAHFNRARCLEELGRTTEALQAYSHCLSRDPKHLEAAAHYAALLEETNQPDAARPWIDQVLAHRPDHVLAGFVAAQLAARAGEPQRALERLDGLDPKRLSPVDRAVREGRRARVLDALGRATEALEAAREGHRHLEEFDRDAGTGGLYGTPSIRFLQDHPEAIAALQSWSSHRVDAGQRLVFLVGFPRSGTTLLDRMLSMHPALHVLEETNPLAPVLARVMASLAESSRPLGVDDLADLLDQAEATLRPADLGDSGWVIDKLPLNSAFSGWLHCLFPRARFLVAIRDPRDTCLSCYLQVFSPNPAMRHFRTLLGTAAYYDLVMGVFETQRRRILPPDRVHLQVYERLVRNPAGELQALCDFLGLDFEPAMVHPERRLAGIRIGTPSYDQVSRPIQSDRVEHWRAYAPALEPVAPILDPWVRHWGYE
jgi:tetratricopeptide (TPR) repeat protein